MNYIVYTGTKNKYGNTHEPDPNHRQCNLVEAINQRGGYYQNVQVADIMLFYSNQFLIEITCLLISHTHQNVLMSYICVLEI